MNLTDAIAATTAARGTGTDGDGLPFSVTVEREQDGPCRDYYLAMIIYEGIGRGTEQAHLKRLDMVPRYIEAVLGTGGMPLTLDWQPIGPGGRVLILFDALAASPINIASTFIVTDAGPPEPVTVERHGQAYRVLIGSDDRAVFGSLGDVEAYIKTKGGRIYSWIPAQSATPPAEPVPDSMGLLDALAASQYHAVTARVRLPDGGSVDANITRQYDGRYAISVRNRVQFVPLQMDIPMQIEAMTDGGRIEDWVPVKPYTTTEREAAYAPYTATVPTIGVPVSTILPAIARAKQLDPLAVALVRVTDARHDVWWVAVGTDALAIKALVRPRGVMFVIDGRHGNGEHYALVSPDMHEHLAGALTTLGLRTVFAETL